MNIHPQYIFAYTIRKTTVLPKDSLECYCWLRVEYLPFHYWQMWLRVTSEMQAFRRLNCTSFSRELLQSTFITFLAHLHTVLTHWYRLDLAWPQAQVCSFIRSHIILQNMQLFKSIAYQSLLMIWDNFACLVFFYSFEFNFICAMLSLWLTLLNHPLITPQFAVPQML